jgi:hypothetical protein
MGVEMDIVYESLFKKVEIVIESKLEEFHYQNYTEITAQDIWQYCIAKKWKKQRVEELSIAAIVSTIFALKPSEIVSYVHVSDLYQTSLNIGLDLEELNMLLKPLKSE